MSWARRGRPSKLPKEKGISHSGGATTYRRVRVEARSHCFGSSPTVAVDSTSIQRARAIDDDNAHALMLPAGTGEAGATVRRRQE